MRLVFSLIMAVLLEAAAPAAAATPGEVESGATLRPATQGFSMSSQKLSGFRGQSLGGKAFGIKLPAK